MTDSQSAQAIGQPFKDTDGANLMNDAALNVIAANLSPIAWTFDAEGKRYNGVASWGRIELLRNAKNNRLVANYFSMDGGTKMRVRLDDQEDIAHAKVGVVRKIVQALNGSRRLDTVAQAQAEIVPEPDLI